jgi:hypothetical protein
VAFALALVWAAWGAWPIAPVECDSNTIATSIAALAHQGQSAYPLTYNFQGTSGTYAIVAALSRWTGVGTLTAFAVASALAALATLLIAANWIAQLTRTPMPYVALGLLLFQEATTSMWYPCSNTLAGLPLLLATLTALRATGWRGWIAAGALFGVAGVIRGDVVLFAPIVGLALWRPGPMQRSVQAALVAGATAAFVTVATMAAAGVDFPKLFHAVGTVYGRTDAEVPTGSAAMQPWILYLVTTFGPVLPPLILLGWWRQGRNRQWHWLLLSVLGTLLPIVVLGKVVPSPKTYAWSIPLTGLAVIEGCKFLVEQRGARWQWARVAMVLVLLGQLFLGLRLGLRSKPWGDADGFTLATLHRQTFADGPVAHLEVVLGAGTVLPTNDGWRLATGTFWAPAIWHRERLQRVAALDAIESWVRSDASAHEPAWHAFCDAVSTVSMAAERNDYTFISREENPQTRQQEITWQRGDRRLVQVLGDAGDFDLHVYAQPPSHTAFYVAGTGRDRVRLLEQAPHATAILDAPGWMPLTIWHLPQNDVDRVARMPGTDNPHAQ